MTTHRYDWQGLRGDYIRAAVGTGISAAALVASGGAGLAGYLFGFCTGLFALFGLRTAIRHESIFELTAQSIRRSNATRFGPPPVTLMWSGIRAVKLNFYSTRRDRSSGWMQLKLAGDGGRISLDSTIEGFDVIARRAAEAAMENGLTLGAATVSNFAAAGIRVHSSSGETERGREPGR